MVSDVLIAQMLIVDILAAYVYIQGRQHSLDSQAIPANPFPTMLDALHPLGLGFEAPIWINPLHSPSSSVLSYFCLPTEPRRQPHYISRTYSPSPLPRCITHFTVYGSWWFLLYRETDTEVA